jgi:predicted porin
MRKLVLTLALFGCTSAICHAQSRVTLYGILDEGVMFLSNAGGPSGSKRIYLDSVSGLNGSRFGLTGSEDLGAGSQAIFTIEPGLNINTGQSAQGGTFLGRQAFVGLRSDTLGAITLGRQYDMIAYYAQPVTVQGSQASSLIFLHPGDIDNTGNSARVNNAIRYASPSYHGFTFGAEYSVGGVAGNVTAGSGYSLGTAYANGPFTFGAAFEYFKNPTSTAGTGLFTNNANGASILSQSINKGYASATAYQTFTVGVGYALNKVTLTTSYSNTQYANLGGILSGATVRFNAIDFGAKWLARPDMTFTLGYVYTKGAPVSASGNREIGNQHYNQIMLLGDYLLSKRTDVYVEGAWQRASGTSSLGTPAVADIGNVGDSSNNHQLLFRAALRHKF